MKQPVKHTGKKNNEAAMESIVHAVNAIMPMTAGDLELLFPILQSRVIKRNGFLLREGEVCRSVYFLISGFFRMFYIDHEGNEINYRFTDENKFFVDFQSFLSQKPCHFYWQAMEDSQLYALPYHDIQQAYAVSPAWNNFGRLMAEHVYLQLNERVEMLLFMSPEERYKYLLDMKPELFARVSQFHLSSYMGIKPESLSRLRKRLLKK